MNKKGSIVLGFTFTMMLAAAITFFFSESEIQNQMISVKRESMIINMDMTRYAVQRSFEDANVISRTIHAPENQTGTVGLLACLTNPNVACENVEKDLVLIAPIPGRRIIDPLLQSNGKFFGFSLGSTACSLASCNNLQMKDFMCDTFDPSVTNGDCNFRLRITWRPICPAIGPCLKPRIIWMLRLETVNNAQARVGAINPDRYYVEKLF